MEMLEKVEGQAFLHQLLLKLQKKIYNQFIEECKEKGIKTEKGIFGGANMEVGLKNQGPVTILIDSKKNFLGGILLKVVRIPAGIYAANCYLVYSENNKEAIVIDPGGDPDDIISKIEDLELDIKYIILTHGHGDHIGGIGEMKKYKDVPVAIHREDEFFVKGWQ